MTSGQRRTLWACLFAMTFIFWYEASGVPLVWQANIPVKLDGEAARSHFGQQMGIGAAFLFLGAVLSIVLRAKEPREPYLLGDWVALVLALGMLAGTAYRSCAAVFGGAGP